MNRRSLLFMSAQLLPPLKMAAGKMTVKTDHSNIGWQGVGDGLRHWRLPDTHNGLKPSQCWHAVGSAPDGAIYIGGMDHKTNSALYCINSKDDTLRLLGDARSASEAVSNWLPGETAQKFHTRPLWHQGKIYVATLNNSNMDRSYLKERGFHWYRYDDTGFKDISVSEKNGIAAQHVGLVTLASDPRRNLIYGASIPTADVFCLDVAKQYTYKVGRPKQFETDIAYTNRVMWLDDAGRLYITAGNPGYKDPELPCYNHVYSYNPEIGEFKPHDDWKLAGGRALEVGQHLRHLGMAYFSDDQGCIYRFDYDPLRWTYLGKPKLHETHYTMWSFNVTHDGRTAYMITTCRPNNSSLFEIDLSNCAVRRSKRVIEFGKEFNDLSTHTGYDSWDAHGRFYFTSFSTDLDNIQNVLVTRIDPRLLTI